jgi:ketosteroid isomerase-like protein
VTPEESTTPDLVGLARRGAEALNRRDFDEVESLYAPDAVLRGAEVGTFEGAAAIRALLEGMVSPYEQFRFEIEEALDLGNGVVFGVVVGKGRPVGSTAEVGIRYASVVIFTLGLVERQTNYMNIEEARAAAERLAEERAQADV